MTVLLLIHGYWYAGGIVGQAELAGKKEITSCLNLGNVFGYIEVRWHCSDRLGSQLFHL